METVELELQKLFQTLWLTLATNEQKLDLPAHELNLIDFVVPYNHHVLLNTQPTSTLFYM